MAEHQHDDTRDPIIRILREGNQETFAATREAIMERVLAATLQEALDDLGSPEAIAERALAAGPHRGAREVVVKAKNALKLHLIDDVARQATDELADLETTVEAARLRVDAEDEWLQQSVHALQACLVQDVATQAAEALADTEATAAAAHACLGDDPAAVARAADELHQRLVQEIAQRATEALADPAAAAQHARALISEEHAALLAAIDHLKEQLLQRIVQESLERINLEVRGAADPARPLAEGRPPSPPTMAGAAVSEAPATPAEGPAEAPPARPATPTAQVLRRLAANGYPASVPDAALNADALPEPDAATAFFLYGVIARPQPGLDADFDGLGLDAASSPYLVPHQSVAAVVGQVPLALFGEADAALPQAALERVLEQAQATYGLVLPMYDALPYASERLLRHALAQHAGALDATLHLLAHRRQWDVKIYCDPDRVRQALEANDALFDAFAAQFAETVSMWSEAGPAAEVEALHAGRAAPLGPLIEVILTSCEQRSHRVLGAFSLDTHRAALAVGQVFGNSSMVLDASYLIEEALSEDFRAALGRLVAEHENLGLVYYVKGPHLPCRFTLADTPSL